VHRRDAHSGASEVVGVAPASLRGASTRPLPWVKIPADRSGCIAGRDGAAQSCAAPALSSSGQSCSRAKGAIEAHVEAFVSAGVIEALEHPRSDPPDPPDHGVQRLRRWRGRRSSLKRAMRRASAGRALQPPLLLQASICWRPAWASRLRNLGGDRHGFVGHRRRSGRCSGAGPLAGGEGRERQVS